MKLLQIVVATLVISNFVSGGFYSNISSLQDTSCAPGLDGDPCQCRASAYRGLLKCKSKRAYITHGYWIGECENETLCTGNCPFGFCSYNDSKDYRLPGTVSELDEYICGDTRTGVLCGECRPGYSVSYHSYFFRCTPDDSCKYSWLLYIVSELLPLIVFFIIVTVFNISFTSGAINSFILFAQLQDSLAIHDNGVDHVSFANRNVILISDFVYRSFNFDFFSMEELSFCLWKGATTLDAMAFKYVTVVSGLILMLICVFVMNSLKVKRCLSCLRPSTLRSSLIHGLSAFFVMCYSQCALVSLRILTPGYLWKEEHQYLKAVVYRSGHLSMFEPAHLKYAIPAIFFSSTLLLLPPLVLILYPLLGKILDRYDLNESKFADFVSRFVPLELFECFQSSFRDNVRFFAGFYFLYRVIMQATFSYSDNRSAFYCIAEVFLIVILALHATVQPYKKKRHNAVDVLLFANLAVINVFSLLIYHKASIKLQNSSIVVVSFYVQVILIYLPLACLVVAGLVKAWKLVSAHCKKNNSGTENLLDSNTLPPLRDNYELYLDSID